MLRGHLEFLFNISCWIFRIENLLLNIEVTLFVEENVNSINTLACCSLFLLREEVLGLTFHNVVFCWIHTLQYALFFIGWIFDHMYIIHRRIHTLLHRRASINRFCRFHPNISLFYHILIIDLVKFVKINLFFSYWRNFKFFDKILFFIIKTIGVDKTYGGTIIHLHVL